mgnify:CR=1 FL=1|tara:strand:- start:44593 stop:44922 length:330 start_codon:yes stop_codon:yes gene_type:complete
MKGKLFVLLFVLLIALVMYLRKHYDAIRAMKTGVTVNRNGLWIGAHYSPYNRRWCINILPCITWWIVKKGGNVPDRCKLKPIKKTDIAGGMEFYKNADMMISVFNPKNK